MFHIVAELIDGGSLTRERLASVEWCIRFYDPVMLLKRPGKRPPEIAPIDDEYSSPAREGAPAAENPFEVACEQTPDGFVVIAEHTTVKRLERERPQEVRQSVLCLEETLEPEAAAESFFYPETRRLVSDYPFLYVGSTPPPLILSHWGRGFESPGDRWLALNPPVGRELGFTLVSSEHVFFAWADAEGRRVIWSEWWQDGLVDHPDVPSRDEAGEGWRVLATKEGYKKIKEHYPNLQRHIRIERRRWVERDWRRTTRVTTVEPI